MHVANLIVIALPAVFLLGALYGRATVSPAGRGLNAQELEAVSRLRAERKRIAAAHHVSGR